MTGWRKSSFRAPGECVEVQLLTCGGGNCGPACPGDGVIQIREGGDPLGRVSEFSRDAWAAFVAGVKAGEFDNL